MSWRARKKKAFTLNHIDCKSFDTPEFRGGELTIVFHLQRLHGFTLSRLQS